MCLCVDVQREWTERDGEWGRESDGKWMAKSVSESVSVSVCTLNDC